VSLTSSSGSLLLDGEAIHVEQSGAGDPIVLVHGFPSSSFSFHRLAPILARRRRVIALDLPGLGLSHRDHRRGLSLQAHADRIARLLDALGIERASVLGVSMGGGVAQRLAATHPERVDRLVLVASVDESDRRRWRWPWFTLLAMSACLRVPPLARLAVLAGLWVSAERLGSVTSSMVETCTRPLLRRGTIRCLWRFVADNGRLAALDLAAVRAPTLVVSAGRDRIVGRQETDRIAAAIPGARHVIVPGAGHMIAIERPEELAAIVEGFLDE
jgi:pimeloyl-ACP methyl ester carboxylesterase